MELVLDNELPEGVEKNENQDSLEEPNSFIKVVMERKLSLLRKQIKDIDTEIYARNALHSELESSIDSRISDREERLKEFPKTSSYTNINNRINLTERELSDLEKEKRTEKLNFWRDSSKLREEIRKLLKEYEEIYKKNEFLASYQ